MCFMEKQGKDYLFLDQATFARRITRGYFLEWEKVFNNFYKFQTHKLDDELEKIFMGWMKKIQNCQ